MIAVSLVGSLKSWLPIVLLVLFCGLYFITFSPIWIVDCTTLGPQTTLDSDSQRMAYLPSKPLAEAALKFADDHLISICHRGIQAETAGSCAPRVVQLCEACPCLRRISGSRRRPNLLGFLYTSSYAGCSNCDGAHYIAAFHAFLTIMAT
jgi:hypothetical protein